ncbi:MAG TPA: protein kinase, partial [Myxococcaceae bacterium]|nr:protein kinase [Myxococcaceae bacterium]
MVGFERYEIIRKLKEDEIGKTLVARCPEREEPVALKIFKPQGRPKALIARLMGQLEGCRQLREPRLVKHLDVGRSSDGGLYLATQLLEGENLAERLSCSGPLSPVELIRLVLPLSELVERLREQGFYYPELRACDVFLPAGASPCESVLLDAGRAWLADCGVFRAPECQPGDSGDRRADVFALGVLMYEALEGRPPFLEEAADPWRRRADCSLSSLHGTSLALSGIIDRCLSRNPRERFESPSVLARALSEGSPPSGISPAVSAADDVADGVKPGDCLGSYRLERQLGAGSMGRVFLGKHVRLGRTAAIKVLRCEYAQNPWFVERFFQEAKAVNRINHEHIVEVLDFVEEHI